ncbi:MAG: hypothetical protein IJI44_04265 [Erysipelotrichaceae bacterium]|nr:hypothetical protein [Erysipelotrichaceae bacterium]
MIRTILKDISSEELGLTLAHEHFIVDLDRIRKDGYSFIQNVDEVVPEIRKAMDQGIQSAFEVTTNDMGRDVWKLKEIAEKTGLNIVCSTGFYLAEYHPEWLNEASAEQIAEVYVKDLTEGIDGTDIKAGLIAEIASSSKGFVGNERKILTAAGIASRRTGFAVSTHTGRIVAQETIDILLKEGVDPDKIILGHQDLIDDSEYHLSLLRQGINIAFDTCGKTAYMPDETRARNALKIVEAGYGDHLLLSNDISRHTYFTSFDGKGYLAVMDSVVPLMRQYGLSEEKIHRFLAENPARIVNNPQIETGEDTCFWKN